MHYTAPTILQTTKAAISIQGGPAKSDQMLVDSQTPHIAPGTPPAYEADE
jgi:hypothetical protein